MKKSNIFKWIVLAISVAINIFIIVSAVTNGDSSAAQSGNFSRFLATIINAFSSNAINDGNFESFALVNRKLFGHFGLFAVDGLTTSLAIFLFLKNSKYDRISIVWGGSLVFGLIVASISESFQIFTPGRYGTWEDIGIDFAGYTLGTAVIFAIFLFFNFTNYFSEKNR